MLSSSFSSDACWELTCLRLTGKPVGGRAVGFAGEEGAGCALDPGPGPDAAGAGAGVAIGGATATGADRRDS